MAMNHVNCIHTNDANSFLASPSLTWKVWFRAGVNLLVSELRAGAEKLSCWCERASQRRALMSLDSRGLKDIGISRADAWAEYNKPFWKE